VKSAEKDGTRQITINEFGEGPSSYRRLRITYCWGGCFCGIGDFWKRSYEKKKGYITSGCQARGGSIGGGSFRGCQGAWFGEGRGRRGPCSEKRLHSKVERIGEAVVLNRLYIDVGGGS